MHPLQGGHVFHTTCVNQWLALTTDQSCPFCKTPAKGLLRLFGVAKLCGAESVSAAATTSTGMRRGRAAAASSTATAQSAAIPLPPIAQPLFGEDGFFHDESESDADSWDNVGEDGQIEVLNDVIQGLEVCMHYAVRFTLLLLNCSHISSCILRIHFVRTHFVPRKDDAVTLVNEIESLKREATRMRQSNATTVASLKAAELARDRALADLNTMRKDLQRSLQHGEECDLKIVDLKEALRRCREAEAVRELERHVVNAERAMRSGGSAVVDERGGKPEPESVADWRRENLVLIGRLREVEEYVEVMAVLKVAAVCVTHTHNITDARASTVNKKKNGVKTVCKSRNNVQRTLRPRFVRIVRLPSSLSVSRSLKPAQRRNRRWHRESAMMLEIAVLM